jgi:hypothetical protein
MQPRGKRGDGFAGVVGDVIQRPAGVLLIRCEGTKYKGIVRDPVVDRIAFEEEFRLLGTRAP